jgi:hypothetical protein
VHGWLIPPTTGTYQFWITGDDQALLELSVDADPARAVGIASLPGYTRARQFDKYPQQASAELTLEAGVPYYISAILKEEWGGDHLRVFWQGPGIERQVIPAEVLWQSLLVEEPMVTDEPAFGLVADWYFDVAGGHCEDLFAAPNFPHAPDRSTPVETFALDSADRDQYGLRVRGWLVPPTTGTYRFWIAGDDRAMLRLSPDPEPLHSQTIATLPGHTKPQQWEKYPEQASTEIHLQAGVPYFIEAILKEEWGGDHLRVAWQGPGFDREIIPAEALRPNR